MNVKEKVKKVVDKISGLNFEFNDWLRANVQLDNKPLPVCLYLLPVSGTLNYKNDKFKDYPNCLIAFLDKASLDFDGDTNEQVIERMKAYARQFIVEVNNSAMFERVGNELKYSVVYDMLDVNLTGIVLEIQLKELYGECITPCISK